MTYGAVPRETLQARVAAGAAFLDDKYPGWHDKIDPDTLDMRNGEACALAQATGSSNWSESLERSGLSIRQSADLGFNIHTTEINSDFLVLNEIWADLITRRRNSSGSLYSNEVEHTLKKAALANPTHTVLLTDDEINKAASGYLNIHTLTLNGETIRGSWQTVLNVLNNLEPGDLEVTIR